MEWGRVYRPFACDIMYKADFTWPIVSSDTVACSMASSYHEAGRLRHAELSFAVNTLCTVLRVRCIRN